MTSQKGNDLEQKQSFKVQFHAQETYGSRVTKIMFDITGIQSIFAGQNTDTILSVQTKLVRIRKMPTATDKHRTVRLENVSLTSSNFKMSFRG